MNILAILTLFVAVCCTREQVQRLILFILRQFNAPNSSHHFLIKCMFKRHNHYLLSKIRLNYPDSQAHPKGSLSSIPLLYHKVIFRSFFAQLEAVIQTR
ncbi:hypothetical protein CbuK_1134 [Coxiella burnetii CbuK_Q154]|nr:hypothetical protein CbuK_1134 [Coxiella burnetii CbuK_Q154]